MEDNLHDQSIMPAQFFGKAGRLLTGERALALAVLSDAVEAYHKHAYGRTGKARNEFELACAWLGSPDRRWPFSFENICDALDIDAEVVRGALARYAPAARTPKRLAAGRGRNRVAAAHAQEDLPHRILPVRSPPGDATARVACRPSRLATEQSDDGWHGTCSPPSRNQEVADANTSSDNVS